MSNGILPTSFNYTAKIIHQLSNEMGRVVMYPYVVDYHVDNDYPASSIIININYQNGWKEISKIKQSETYKKMKTNYREIKFIFNV